MTDDAHQVAALEQRVRMLEAQLAQCEVERDAARDSVRAGENILAAVTHDLRNPLGTIVMGATALLQTDAGADPRLLRVKSVAERVQRQAERMTQQLANLSDFAAIQSGRFTIRRAAQPPSTIVTAAADLARPLVKERSVELATCVEPGLPVVDCDADRVIQVLTNLIGNSVRVTARGTIEIGARRDGDRVVFFVRDTGPGLAADELAGLFSPPWRTQQTNYKGTSLGYAIARGIVDVHGGKLWAESELGAGTAVFFVVG